MVGFVFENLSANASKYMTNIGCR